MTRPQTFNQGAFYASLNAARSAQGLDWKHVSELSGISAPTFTRMAQGRSIDLETFGALCEWSGLNPGSFFHTERWASEPANVARFVAELANDETLSPTARVALGKVVVGAYEALKDLP